jgi:SAM-dependent methyltransferase
VSLWNTWSERAWRKRARRALERQLRYQAAKAPALRGHEREIEAAMRQQSAHAHERVSAVRALGPGARVLEVGSGAHGLIFGYGGTLRVGIDPLALEYSGFFSWQDSVPTIAAVGERLPFRDGAFDVVLCDNIVDHAEGPREIVREMARVLAPDGVLYFTVNVHHPFYGFVSHLHGAWNAAGIPFEIAPFADHTVHLTTTGAVRLFDGAPLRIVQRSAAVRKPRQRARHAGDLLKRVFFKNARLELVAVKATP